ncbi:hypothetical protein [Marinicauda sp. Alg238-R41]|uniref:hypothetical protein n=1 Tax=Marinicauda sp. Alg238-R41 TaxID=2993447 RepID=UPI0022E82C5F|nr:hypothetical protein [Marinicauda sp. Alg238-R41]
MSFIDLPTGCVEDWTPRLTPRPSRARDSQGLPRGNINQLGKVWAFDVSLHAMTQIDALKWIAELNDNTGDGHRWVIDQGSLISGSEGAPLVAGGSQLGTSLDIDGVTNGMVIPQGAFISIITASKRYVYQLASQVTASGTGTATLAFNTPMRVSPADNDVVEIAAPKIEGFVDFDGMSFARRRRFVSGGAQFTITGAR